MSEESIIMTGGSVDAVYNVAQSFAKKSGIDFNAIAASPPPRFCWKFNSKTARIYTFLR
jgi:hypothetical protein